MDDGTILLFGSLINGATMVMYEGVPDFPEADRLWETVDKYEITHLGISPTLIRALMAKGDEYVNKHSLKSLEVFASTGEPWNPDPWMWLFETVGKVMYQFVTIQAGLKFLVEFSETSLLNQLHRLALTLLYQEWQRLCSMIRAIRFVMKLENYV